MAGRPAPVPMQLVPPVAVVPFAQQALVPAADPCSELAMAKGRERGQPCWSADRSKPPVRSGMSGHEGRRGVVAATPVPGQHSQPAEAAGRQRRAQATQAQVGTANVQLVSDGSACKVHMPGCKADAEVLRANMTMESQRQRGETATPWQDGSRADLREDSPPDPSLAIAGKGILAAQTWAMQSGPGSACPPVALSPLAEAKAVEAKEEVKPAQPRLPRYGGSVHLAGHRSVRRQGLPSLGSMRRTRVAASPNGPMDSSSQGARGMGAGWCTSSMPVVESACGRPAAKWETGITRVPNQVRRHW